MSFKCIIMLSHKIEREMEYSATTTLPLNSIDICPHCSPHWYNLHSYLFICHWGESERAYISLTSIRFWRFMPKGEKVWAQSKRTAPPPNFKMKFFKLISYCVQKGEKVVSSKLAKLSWTLRGEFYLGVFCLSQRKSIWNGGENFKSWKCFFQSYSYTFDYLQNDFEKNFTKDLQKQNSWCKCGPKF
jgi:hypothetical protein